MSEKNPSTNTGRPKPNYEALIGWLRKLAAGQLAKFGLHWLATTLLQVPGAIGRCGREVAKNLKYKTVYCLCIILFTVCE